MGILMVHGSTVRAVQILLLSATGAQPVQRLPLGRNPKSNQRCRNHQERADQITDDTLQREWVSISTPNGHGPATPPIAVPVA
jgi:hypothetical protein